MHPLRMNHRLLVWALALAACAGVFAAWLNPHLAVEVAAFVRSCF
jgi:hypothetical protein